LPQVEADEADCGWLGVVAYCENMLFACTAGEVVDVESCC
jgi:hypothetical protein